MMLVNVRRHVTAQHSEVLLVSQYSLLLVTLSGLLHVF
jgi:hypothetical protein